MSVTEYRLTPDNLRSVALYLAEIMRAEFNKKPDAVRLRVPVLAKQLGVSIGRIRAAIRAGHYGTIHAGVRGRDLFYATLEEATAYHFEEPKKDAYHGQTPFHT